MPPHDARQPVWLVGAGPGDPELLTLKAARLLAAAEIVFYDALVGPGILYLANPKAELVSVGKRSGRHSKDQASINDLLLEAARSGRRVVRLKGGDPSIFGRSTEEIEHLVRHGVPVEICPGITAASAAAASGRTSLTLRGSARKLTLVTAHARAGETLDLDWAALASPDATLMVAVNVSLPNERLIRGKLSALAFLVRTISECDPALLLIGEAVAAIGADAVQLAEQVRLTTGF
jgi:uroporphyrin-III C-methyltransferase